jgi:hypothetical protein
LATAGASGALSDEHAALTLKVSPMIKVENTREFFMFLMLLKASAGVPNQPSRMVARAAADRRDRRAEHHAPRQGAYAASATVGALDSAARCHV